MKDLFDTINNRRSVREFKKEQLKDEEIRKILDAGFMAPTARGEEPWHFTVIQNKDILEFINKRSLDMMKDSNDEFLEMIAESRKNILHDAPTVIIVSAKSNATNKQADSSAAIQNILLAAEGLNIGSCWIGLIQIFFEDKENIAKIKIPEDYTPMYAVALGYKVRENIKIQRSKDAVNWIR